MPEEATHHEPVALPGKKPSAWWFVLGALVVVVGIFVFQVFGPSPAVVVSKETTYITEPLGPDGLPDYERYLLERLRDGVTPENNAAVLLMRALWPGGYPPQEQEAVARELGLVPLPQASDVIVPLTGNPTTSAVARWLREMNKIPVDASVEELSLAGVPVAQVALLDEQAIEIIDQAIDRPWSSAQIPPLGDWITRNRTAIDTIFAATRRPRCYFPSAVLLNSERDMLISISLTGIQTSREAARALSARAMWNLGEGRLDAAWEDALAIHRLARLLAQDTTLVGQLVAIAIDGMAVHVDAVILGDRRISAELARRILSDLGQLAPASNMAGTMRGMERLWGLDAVLAIKTNGAGSLMSPMGVDGEGIYSMFGVVSLDWNLVLAGLNRRYDEIEAVFTHQDRWERLAASGEFEKQFDARQRDVLSPTRIAGSLISRRERSNLAVDLVSALLLPALTAASAAEDRSRVYHELVRVAAALAVFRAEQGSYPDQLTDLAPGILGSLPIDGYSPPPGRPFLYRRDEDGLGFVLYSVYMNETDDGGTHFDGSIVDGKWMDEPDASLLGRNAGDMVIRVPGQELAIPK